MPVTLSYDLRTNDPNHRSYIRSMLERFAWRRLGGSVFRYSGRTINGVIEEDWLNDVSPSLMFVRSYTIQQSIEIRFLLSMRMVFPDLTAATRQLFLGARPTRARSYAVP